MRYSFHGKVRATGQQVDGYVEAASSSEAIDRLADQGIIGVHTVRPEAKKQRNTVTLSGDDVYEDEPAPVPASTALATAPQFSAPQPIYIPVPTPAPAAAPADTSTQVVLGQLVEKLATLLGQVEKLLSRPQQIIYQSGPARGGGGGDGAKRKSRQVTEAQDSTLRAIFQTNMDLRRSLDTLSTVVSNGASNGSVGPAAVSNGTSANGPAVGVIPGGAGSNGSGYGSAHSGKNGSTSGSSGSSQRDASPRDSSPREPSQREIVATKPSSGGRERAQKTQPAA